jgi:translation initiation factor 4G
MIGLIFKKALTEPHYCETYADLVFSLKARLPEFSAPDGGKPVTFKAALLNTVQEEYEALPKVLEPTEEERAQFPEPAELQLEVKKRKDRFIANMKFIGHLFLRHLLSAKVISSVLQDLTTCDALDDTPHEHKIECVIELLESIGYTLESMPTGQQALAQVYGRLLELKKQKSASGRCFLSKRLQFRVQDLLDMRSAGWTKKVFKAQAKTKKDIRLDQEHGLDVAARIVAGARPEYVAASKLR